MYIYIYTSISLYIYIYIDIDTYIYIYIYVSIYRYSQPALLNALARHRMEEVCCQIDLGASADFPIKECSIFMNKLVVKRIINTSR